MKILYSLTIGLLLSATYNLHSMWAFGVLSAIYKHYFTQKTTFNDLPPEIVEHIASFLPCKLDIKNMRLANRQCGFSIPKTICRRCCCDKCCMKRIMSVVDKIKSGEYNTLLRSLYIQTENNLYLIRRLIHDGINIGYQPYPAEA